MCGIVGEIRFDGNRPDDSAIRRMCAAIEHRGPDDEGFFENGEVALGVRRLAIVDIDGGAQPMANERGDVHVVFNGEIYNAPALRRTLQEAGHTLVSHADTEVLVHLYEDLGPAMLDELRGMFVFAIWDESRRRGLVARDRVGIKPLYFTLEKNGLVFASELKAMLRGPIGSPRIDPAALDAYLAHHYIPAPLSIFEHVRKLPPGCVLEIDGGRVVERRYWTIDEPRAHWSSSEQTTIKRMRELIEESVAEHLMSDVPLGVFLSGGVDSSVIAALMAREMKEPLRTFSIRFEEQTYDESPFARAVAEHIGASHTEETVRADAVGLLPKLTKIYDEPFGDQAAIPGYYLAEVAASHLKVCLSGDGADELFAGYHRYHRSLSMARLDWIPAQLRGAAARIGTAVLPEYVRGHHFLQKVAGSRCSRYQREFDGFDAASRRALLAPEFAEQVAEDGRLFEPFFSDGDKPFDGLAQMQLTDINHYLPECILAKVDRITMAHSLEVRVPYLDHRIVETALSLPPSLKVRGKRDKWILRDLSSDLLPAGILGRSKQGFNVPLKEWFREDLKTYAEKVLLSSRARGRGILRPEAVQRLLDMHGRGRRSFSDRIYSLLFFEHWCRVHLDGDRA